MNKIDSVPDEASSDSGCSCSSKSLSSDKPKSTNPEEDKN